MIVKCVKFYSEHYKKFTEKGSNLTLGKEYVVMQVFIFLDKVEFTIVGDNTHSPGRYNASQFEIVSRKKPSNWEINNLDDSPLLKLCPKAWSDPYFFNYVFEDENKEAIEVYKREATIIYNEA